MVFDSEHYNFFMYIAISLVVMLMVLNSISIVETGLSDFEKNSNRFGRGLTGLVVDEVIAGTASENAKGLKVGKFSEYIGKVIEVENENSKFARGLTGLAIIEDGGNSIDQYKTNQVALELSEEEEEERLKQKFKGELYTEGSYMIYYTLLGFFVLGIFIISIIFFLPKLKDYS